MQATQEQIQQWKEKYGTIYELESEGKTCFIFDPSNKLIIMKALIQAQSKSSSDYVDTLLANCWIDGDAEIKTNEQIKLGLVDQVQDILDIPEPEVRFLDAEKKAVITVEGKEITVKLASRQDVKVAEDKNRQGKPLDTQIYLLEKVAESEDLKVWREYPRLYLGLLLAMDKVKDKKYVSLKKH